MTPHPNSASKAWHTYFESNVWSPDELPWHCSYRLSGKERQAVQASIQQFQLGEGAEGRRLLKRGAAWAARSGDQDFVDVLSLFIKEEQRHSRQLLRFMEREGIPSLSKHWVDNVFRRVRVLAGLELELRVLVTAEVIAVPYYRALGRATRSDLLTAISNRILEDEAAHLRFQRSMLSRLGATRAPGLRCMVWQAHRLFLVGTCCVVWMEHRSVFRAAGYTFGRLLEESLAEMSGLESQRRAHAAAKFGDSRSAVPDC